MGLPLPNDSLLESQRPTLLKERIIDSSFRDIWKQAKDEAKRMNNGREVTMAGSAPGRDLGPRLDAWEKAAEALERARLTDGEDAARSQARSALGAVSAAFAAYASWLGSNPVALKEVVRELAIS